MNFFIRIFNFYAFRWENIKTWRIIFAFSENIWLAIAMVITRCSWYVGVDGLSGYAPDSGGGLLF